MWRFCLVGWSPLFFVFVFILEFLFGFAFCCCFLCLFFFVWFSSGFGGCSLLFVFVFVFVGWLVGFLPPWGRVWQRWQEGKPKVIPPHYHLDDSTQYQLVQNFTTLRIFVVCFCLYISATTSWIQSSLHLMCQVNDSQQAVLISAPIVNSHLKVEFYREYKNFENKVPHRTIRMDQKLSREEAIISVMETSKSRD